MIPLPCVEENGEEGSTGSATGCELQRLLLLLFFPEMAHSHSSPGLDAAVSTKVLYFTDRSLTPFLINIPKR